MEPGDKEKGSSVFRLHAQSFEDPGRWVGKQIRARETETFDTAWRLNPGDLNELHSRSDRSGTFLDVNDSINFVRNG